LPNGYTQSPKDRGNDDGLDSDADLTTLQTPVTTLVTTEEDKTWDLGIFITGSCLPPILTIVNPAAVCYPSTVNISATTVQTVNTGVTTTYWKDAAATIALDGTSGTATAIQASGTYYIKSTTSNTTCLMIKPVVVTINPLPAFTLASTNITCNGAANGTITITTTSGAAPFEYSKDDAATFQSNGGIYNGLAPNPYKPAVKDANGCVKKCN
jgi:hypothetical protein